MKIILSSRRRHYLARFGTFLIAVALIVGMVACTEPIGEQEEEEEEEESLFSLCIDFEDPLLGTEYHLGDTFGDSGAVIVVENFDWGGGVWCNGGCGYTKVHDSPGWCGGSGQYMEVNNVNLRIVYDGPWEKLSLLFGAYGGNLNININGHHMAFDDFHDIHEDIIGGVDVSVVNGFGGDEGSLTLSGTINSFSIGGQQLCIDDVCLTIPS